MSNEITKSSVNSKSSTARTVSLLTYAMFFMFAMTTDAIGKIISIVKPQLELSNTEASMFHFATMIGIAISAISLGWLADRYGRKPVIIIGLALYGLSSAAFFFGTNFLLYLSMLFAGGFAIGVFKTAALALIGDIVESTDEHTSKMNMLEGFFGIGAIVGPLLVGALIANGLSWKYVYLIAAAMCALMIFALVMTKFPEAAVHKANDEEKTGFLKSLSMVKSPVAVFFSLAIAFYVGAEAAIYVWLPEYLAPFFTITEEGKREYIGPKNIALLATNAVVFFFILRAIGRFMGVWILERFNWKHVMVVFTGAIFALYLISALTGRATATVLLPLTGIFMAMIYPTINSKAISCFKKEDHGAIAGLVLFFTAVAAAVLPLLMGWASDKFGGDLKAGFVVATTYAGLLFAFMLYNLIRDPAARALAARDEADYNK